MFGKNAFRWPGARFSAESASDWHLGPAERIVA